MEITHLAPRAGGAATLCCRLNPMTLPPSDRISSDPKLTTCTQRPVDKCNLATVELQGYYIGERYCFTHGGHTVEAPCPRNPSNPELT